jgi:hypothetical protein
MNFGDIFTSRLHTAHLKAAGFKKKGRIFIRLHNDYAEEFQIQGSAWNSAGEAWRFYVNCGIRFDNLATDIPKRGFADTHAACRIRHLVADAPDQYEVSEGDLDDAVNRIWMDLSACSAYFSRRNQVLRESCMIQKFAGWFLDDTEIRKTS